MRLVPVYIFVDFGHRKYLRFENCRLKVPRHFTFLVHRYNITLCLLQPVGDRTDEMIAPLSANMQGPRIAKKLPQAERRDVQTVEYENIDWASTHWWPASFG